MRDATGNPRLVHPLLKECDVVPLEAALEWAPGCKQPSSRLIVTVSVDRWAVLLLLDAVQILEEQVVPLLKMEECEAFPFHATMNKCVSCHDLPASLCWP